MKTYIEKVASQSDLSLEEMEVASAQLFDENVDELQKAGFLMALRTKGETVDELTGLAKVMQKVAVQLPRQLPDVMNVSREIDPISDTRPRSFRLRSTSILCSACSFSSDSRSAAYA